MSGTSLDGLDIALCKIHKAGLDTHVELLNFKTVDYDSDFQNEIKSIFAKETASLLKVTLLNEFIGVYFAELILKSLKEWKIETSSIDLIASHGQTIFHAPAISHNLERYNNATLQIGDGDHIAVKSGIITLSDFRQKHIAAGGEGAPLAVYGDFLIFSDPEEKRILLNIGGIANFTFLPSRSQPESVFSTDIGPGNTLMDQFVQANYSNIRYDKNSEIASSGKVNEKLLNALLSHSFFQTAVPKTTGPELFNLNYLNEAISTSGTNGISNNDALATLCRFSALSITRGIKDAIGNEPYVIYLSGGGMYNTLLITYIKNELPNIKLKSTADLGINPDAKEAVLFAVLANETIAGKQMEFGNGSFPRITMGKISLPG
ncbi:MAG TPA: anhydro-N-acetylmuramic acid kinase [Pedobacter sp.]|jgi:anhydro-N-acetylmuramic acid kinase